MTQLETIHPNISVDDRGRSKSMQYARAFAGLFMRDLHVLRRELFPSRCACA